MSNSEDQDIRRDVAVLTAKFEAGQQSTATGLDSIKSLLMQEQANLRAQMEYNRSTADMRLKSLESDVSGLKSGVEEGKLDRARASGRAGVVAGVVSVAVGIGMLALSAVVKAVWGL